MVARAPSTRRLLLTLLAGADGVGLFIHAMATYTDGLGTEEETASGAPVARVQSSDPANTAPKFPDQDLCYVG